MKEVFVQHGVYKHGDDSVDSRSHIRDLKVLIITNKTQTYGALRATAFYNFLQHFTVFRLGFIHLIRQSLFRSLILNNTVIVSCNV